MSAKWFDKLTIHSKVNEKSIVVLLLIVLITSICGTAMAKSDITPLSDLTGKKISSGNIGVQSIEGFIETDPNDPDWALVTSNHILRENICIASGPDPYSWYDRVFNPCYYPESTLYWKLDSSTNIGKAFPMSGMGIGTFDGLYVREGFGFQLYYNTQEPSDPCDLNPASPYMCGPQYVSIDCWRDVYPAPDGFEPNTFFVSGGPGALSNYSIIIDIGYCGLYFNKVDDVNDGNCVWPGCEITYTIDYNYPAGPNVPDINDVNIIDELPDEVDFNEASDGGSYDPISNTVVWNLGTLQPGESGFVTLIVKVKYPKPGGIITNHCEIKSGNDVLRDADENTQLCYYPYPTITKVDNIPDGNCVGPGDNITYTICYDANGYDDTGVEIVDDLPDELEFISATAPYQENGGTITWDLDTWEPNESNCVTLTVKVLCPQPGSTITNSCEVTGDCMTIPVIAGENTSVCISPTITKVDNIPDGNFVKPGDYITYRICFTANGYGDKNVIIIDVLPNEVNFISTTGEYELISGTITWDIGDIPRNAHGCITLVVQVNATAEPGGTITNSCELRGDCINPIYAEEETKVGSPTITKEAYIPCAKCVGPGDEIIYSICYDANGFGDTSVVITDYLPDEVKHISGGNYHLENNTVTWSIGNLLPDSYDCIELTVEVNDNASGSRITNYCRMTGDRIDVSYYENTSVYQWCPEFEKGVKTCIWWPLEHEWPNMCTPLQIWTYDDPNGPEGGPGDGANQKVGEHFNNGRGVMQTFTVPPDSNGFMLTDIVIAANGEGNPDITFTLHLFDINLAGPTSDEQSWQNTGGYFPEYNAMPPVTDLFSPCCFKFHNCPDKFVSFTFSPENRAHLEPGHLYAFEIWPSVSDSNAAFYWIRNATDQYTGGLGYECSGTKNGPSPGMGPQDLSAERTHLSGSNRDMVMGVYGIPFDGNAYAPQPRNYATDISVNTTLTWHPGQWAATVDGHKVYFSTNILDVEERVAYIGTFTNPCYTPGLLQFDKTYYWAIDEVNGSTTWSGDVWRFTTTTPKASEPQPASGSTAEFYIDELKLSWMAGAFAADVDGHRVFFGTDFNEVNLASTATGPPIYRGQQTPDSYNLLDLAGDYTLEDGKTYYWRVDEVNEGTAGSPWKGDVWNFTMPQYVIVDAFNYSGQADMDAVWKSSGGSVQGCLGCSMSAAVTATLTGGTMRFIFDNGTFPIECPWSEVKADKNGAGLGMDWTAGGIVNTASLAIGIDGNIASAIDPEYDNVYVAVEDTAGNIGIVYCDDTIIQKRQFGSTEGNVWNIPLSAFDSCDVDLTDINALYIGTGSRCSWGSRGLYDYHGGRGVIFIDNIRLYMPRCLPEKAGPAGDFTGPANFMGDCFVDFYDLAYFTNDWLLTDVTLDYNDAVAPLDDPGNLMVWYKFDTETGTSGTVTVTDSSGNARHGTIGNPNSKLWASDGASGKCLNFEAGLRTWVEVPTSAYQDPNNYPGTTGVTFSFWSAYDINYQPIESLAAKWASVFTMHNVTPPANGDDTSPGSQLIESQVPTPWPPNYEMGPQARFVDMRESGRNIASNRRRFSDFGKRWNHYAFIYDDANDSMRVYLNGKLEANEINAVLPLWPAPGSFRLGTRSNRYYNPGSGFMGPDWGFWGGKLDDFRVYNYALNENEIQWLAKNGTGTRILPLVEPTNLSTAGSPQIINFMDFAIFANDWLMEDFYQ